MDYLLSQIERDIERLDIVTQAKYNARKQQYFDNHGSSAIKLNDFLWSILNESLLEAARNSGSIDQMYINQRTIYNLMADLLRAEGKKVTRITKLRNECDIRRALLLPYEAQLSIVPGNRCTYCPPFEGRLFDLVPSITEFPLNYDLCDREGGCNCLININPKRDSDDMLIQKSDKKLTFWEKVKRAFKL